MAGRPQPGIRDAYTPVSSMPSPYGRFSPYAQGAAKRNKKQKNKEDDGGGNFITDELLGFDDFSWAVKNAQQGNWWDAAKSLGAGVLELGDTVASGAAIALSGGTATPLVAGKYAAKTAAKQALKQGAKQIGEETAEKGAKGLFGQTKTVLKGGMIGQRKSFLDAKDINPFGKGGKGEPLTPPRPAYSSPKPNKPMPSGGGGTKTLEKTETRISNPKQDELEELYNMPSAKPDTNIVPKITPDAKPKLTPGGAEKLSPSSVLRHAKTPALGLRPLGRLGNLVENVTGNSLSPQPEPKYQPDSKQRLNTRVDTENKRRGRVPGSMGTAAADVTIPYVY